MQDPLENTWLSLSPRRVILETPVGSILSERFRCVRTGAEGDFISFDFRNWVIALPVTPSGDFLLIRQFRHGERKVKWEFPGGCVDASDPDMVSAALRELREETGYTGKKARLIGSVAPNPALQFNRCGIVLIEDSVPCGDAEPDETEDIETCILPPDRLLELIRSGEMDHGMMLNAVLFYFMETKGIGVGLQ